MAVLAGTRMWKTQRRASLEKAVPRLVARMDRSERGSHNLKPTIYLPSGVIPRA